MAQSLQQTPTGEIRVETGFGRVTLVRLEGGRRNARVEVDAEHLKLPIVAWVDSHGPLWAHVGECHDLGVRVAYRVEVHRKANVDQAVPLDEVPNTDKVRDLADLHAVDAAGRPLQARAPDRPALEAPDRPAAAAAPPPAALPPGPVIDVTEAAPAAELEAGDPGPPEPARRPAPPAAANTGPVCVGCRGPLAGHAARRGPAGGFVHDPTCPDPGPAAAVEVPAVEWPAAGRPAEAALARARAAQAAADRTLADPALVARVQVADLADPNLTEVHPGWAAGEGYVCRVDGCGAGSEPAGDRLTKTELLDHLRTHIAEVPAADLPDPTPPAGPSGRGPKIAEGRPWETYNGDGTLNLGSYAAGAAAGTIHLAYKLLAARAADVAADTGAADPPTPAKVRSLASSLLAAADTAQAAVRSDGRVDRMANSHTRARGMVRVALDAHPVPFAHYVDESAKWEAALARAATALLTLTAELTETDQ